LKARLGFKDCREAKEGVKYVAKNVEVVWRDRERRDVAMHNHPCYGWYYQTQAMFHAGTTVWPKWNGMFSSQLTRNQHSDGHWDAPPPAAGRKADLAPVSLPIVHASPRPCGLGLATRPVLLPWLVYRDPPRSALPLASFRPLAFARLLLPGSPQLL
jgi:hypothetical protein